MEGIPLAASTEGDYSELARGAHGGRERLRPRGAARGASLGRLRCAVKMAMRTCCGTRRNNLLSALEQFTPTGLGRISRVHCTAERLSWHLLPWYNGPVTVLGFMLLVAALLAGLCGERRRIRAGESGSLVLVAKNIVQQPASDDGRLSAILASRSGYRERLRWREAMKDIQ